MLWAARSRKWFIGLFILLLMACNKSESIEEQVSQLAYVGGDGNVYVTTTVDFQAKHALTHNATVPAEQEGLSYHRLSWSRAGWLAFAAVQRTGQAAQSKLYVLPSLDSQPLLVGESDSHFVIYNYWSPVPCTADVRCQQMAYLIEEEDEIALRLVTIAGDEVTKERISEGWPFYYSWSSDGRSLLWHTGLTVGGDTPSSLNQYDVLAKQSEALTQPLGGFMAPAWSPTGEGWLAVTTDGAVNRLQYFHEEEVETVTAVPGSSINFVWSPNGRQVAYMVRADANDRYYSPIFLYDLDTGQTERISDVGLRPVAFFWSPDGQQLAYLTWIPLGLDELMQWRILKTAEVFETSAVSDRGLALFNPTPLMRFAVNTFNQYAQSHRFWSADGRYLVYAERDKENQDTIWAIDTWADAHSQPIFIDDGTIGYWSW
jgi:TolB protein